MEVDLDIDDLDFGDKVKEFFEHKLNEIKSINLTKEQKVVERKQYLNQTLQAISNSKDKNCPVTWNWKKYFNNKFVICYTVCSNDKTLLGNVKLFLKWSFSKHLNYKHFVYGKDDIDRCKNDVGCQKLTDELKKSSSAFSEAFVVAVIDDPIFLENLDCLITGKLLIHQELLLDLPDVKISSEDYTSRDVCDLSLTTNKLDNILAALSATDNIELILIFPDEWNVSIDSTFEIHCSLTKKQLNCNCKTYFVANRLSQIFDHTILELHSNKTNQFGPFYTNVYYSSKNALLSFLHHVHGNIQGLAIIPKQLYKHYKIKHSKEGSTSEILQRFQECVNKEIEVIETLGGVAGSKAIEYRSKLINLENETDVLYLKVCELNNTHTEC